MRHSFLSRSIFILSISVVIPLSAVAAEQMPTHLQAARTLLSSLAPENTSYRYNGWVRWKGDTLTPYSEAHTDCSGLISTLLERVRCGMNDLPALATSKGKHPKAADYYNFIAKEEGFKRVVTVKDILPGDIIAVKYNAGATARYNSNTGHVMLVNALPVRREIDTKPVVAGTIQWEVLVIDSTAGPHGKADSRHGKKGTKRNGVGSGVFRLYTDAEGKMLGYSWSTLANSVYYDGASRPVAVGRSICVSADVRPVTPSKE